MPQDKRLFRRIVFTFRGGLRLARVTACQLGMQEHNRFAHDFGDARPLAWGDVDLC